MIRRVEGLLGDGIWKEGGTQGGEGGGEEQSEKKEEVRMTMRGRGRRGCF